MKLKDILSVLLNSQEIRIWSMQSLCYCFEGPVWLYYQSQTNFDWPVVFVGPGSYDGEYKPCIYIEIDDRE